MSKTITSNTVEKIRRNLVEFGYKGLTREDVQEQVDKIVAGADKEELSVIGMFAKSMLEENGYID